MEEIEQSSLKIKLKTAKAVISTLIENIIALFKFIFLFLSRLVQSVSYFLNRLLYSNRVNVTTMVPITRNPDSQIDQNSFFKNLFEELVEKQTVCIDFSYNNLLKLTLFIFIFLIILSYLTGKLETRTRGKFKKFIRELPARLAVLLLFLKKSKFLAILIFRENLNTDMIAVINEIKSLFLISFIVISSIAILDVKASAIFDFYSICSYNLFLHIIVVIKGGSFFHIFRDLFMFPLSSILFTLTGYVATKIFKIVFEIKFE